MLELYHHGSSACAAKVRFALEEKQLEWSGHYIDLMKGEQFAPEYVALNPKAVVPTLVHDDNVIPESTIICEYLEDAFDDHPLLPEDALSRAQVRIWTKAVDEELHPACSALTYIVSHRHTILRNGIGSFEKFLEAGGHEGRAARERKWGWIREGLDAPGAAEQVRIYFGFLDKMNRALEQNDWLASGSLTLADVALAPYLFRLEMLSLDSLWRGRRFAAVASWYERISKRPAFDAAFRQWMPEALEAEMKANGQGARGRIAEILES